ncbi:unnamed protein product [Musa hybrid cultivar]
MRATSNKSLVSVKHQATGHFNTVCKPKVPWWTQLLHLLRQSTEDPVDVAKHVMREASLRGLYKGLVRILECEVPGNIAALFGVYEALKRYFAGG